MDEKEILQRFSANAPGFITMLGGQFTAVSSAAGSCTINFDVSTDFCHSINIVQGGFVTAMLDAAMSHAAFATTDDIAALSSLEIKTSYLEPSRAGLLRAEGLVIKMGYKTAFLEGRLYDPGGLLTATTSSVAKVVRRK
jgi:uncharacterized protein (TIGR00369 family)